MAKDDGFEGVDRTTDPAGDDVAEAMAAIDALETADGGEEPNTTDNSEGKTDDTPAGAPSGAKEEPGVEVEPSGVLAADGKNIIPYDVLKSTREREDQERRAKEESQRNENEARRLLAEAQANLDTLREAGKQPQPGVTIEEEQGAVSDRVKALKEQADAVREELPAMAGVLDGLITELEEVAKVRKSLEARDAEAKTQRESAEQAAQRTAQEAVRLAMDSTPVLAYWEAQKDPAAVNAYNRACDEDDLLRKDPAWLAKPMTERFAEAVRRTLLVMPDAPKPPTTLSKEQVEARALKAVKEAGEFDPNSLSDLPAGAPPGADPLENLVRVDSVALGNRMERMTDDQITELLRRAG